MSGGTRGVLGLEAPVNKGGRPRKRFYYARCGRWRYWFDTAEQAEEHARRRAGAKGGARRRGTWFTGSAGCTEEQIFKHGGHVGSQAVNLLQERL